MYETGDHLLDLLKDKVVHEINGDEGDEELEFHTTDGMVLTLYHDRDCCESVQVNEIVGDLDDLIGVPILEVYCETNQDEGLPENEYDYDHYTWTFYRFTTIKGTVTVRWLGTSNGYYSERVDVRVTDGQT